MGKETKIGLAVIAVLVAVFSVLLFRHLAASHSLPTRTETAAADVKPLATSPSQPDVVVTPEESRITGSKLWDTPSTDSAAKEPSARGADPYAAVEPQVLAEAEQAVAAAAETVAPVGRSPFHSGPAAANQAGNPLRRASAELPLETPAADEQPAAEDPGAPASSPVMTLPDGVDASSAEASPLEAAPAGAPPTEDTESVPGHAAPDFDAPQSTHAADPGAPGEPFPNAEPAAAETLIAATAADQFTPAEAPDNSVEQFEPRQSNEPAPAAVAPASAPRNAFDQFESPQPVATEQQPTAAPMGEAQPDTWRGEGPAAAPLAADAREAAPLPVENGKYTVQPGDSLWTVSEAVYGTGGYFKALAAHNRAVLPRSDALTVGSQIAVPTVEELQRDYASLCPRPRKSAVVQAGATRASAPAPRSGKDIYIVNQGDTLFDIARFELGKATRWAEIYDLNRETLGEDFDYLRPGTELVMPPRGAAASAPESEPRY